jgi:cell division protein FtsB
MGITMKRILLSLWIGCVVYSLTLFFFGPAGFQSMKHLESEAQRLDDNLVELQAINAKLELRAKNLESDDETIRLVARDYGYIQPGERIIKLSGSKPVNTYQVAGRILHARENPNSGIIFPFIAALIASASFLGLSFRPKRKTRNASFQEFATYP